MSESNGSSAECLTLKSSSYESQKSRDFIAGVG